MAIKKSEIYSQIWAACDKLRGGVEDVYKRQAHDNQFQILWPERRDFAVEDHEYFEFLEGNRLYTSVWYEDPDYREELLVRDYDTGEVLERIPGSIRRMPDGQKWLLV